MDETLPAPRDHAQAYALTFPGAFMEHPWGETMVKVNKKVFLFVTGAIAPEDGVSLSVKLPRTGTDLLEMPFAEPMGYGMGKQGWVTLLLLRDDHTPLELLEAWIDESTAPSRRRAVSPSWTRCAATRLNDLGGERGQTWFIQAGAALQGATRG